jgi:hypothetical protein
MTERLPHDLNCLTISELQKHAAVMMDKQTRDYYNEVSATLPGRYMQSKAKSIIGCRFWQYTPGESGRIYQIPHPTQSFA